MEIDISRNLSTKMPYDLASKRLEVGEVYRAHLVFPPGLNWFGLQSVDPNLQRSKQAHGDLVDGPQTVHMGSTITEALRHG